MTRQKKPLQKVIDKYEEFLKALISNSGGYNITLDEMISEYQINKYIKTALINLKIIDLETDKKWYWLSYNVDKNLILTILNYILEKSKKTPQVNLPLEGFTKALEQQNEILEYLRSIKQDRSPNGFKMPLKETNLFEKEDLKEQRRWEMYKAILTALYSGHVMGDLSADLVDILNEFALSVSDNALVKFYSKQKVNVHS